jgi:hypothetical protein
MSRWREVAAELESYATQSSQEQRDLGDAIGVAIAQDTPFPVAARALSAHLQRALDLKATAETISEGQLDYLTSLQEELELTDLPDFELLSYSEADGWVRALLATRAARGLRLWEPDTGDEVSYVRTGDRYDGIVSSIGGDGTVYLRGVGKRVRPDRISSITHVADLAEGRAAEVLSNELARRPAGTQISVARTVDLEPYRVRGRFSEAAISAFDDALDGANIERPMQVVLETHPELFRRVVTGNHGLWVLPQVQFSNVYMADFLIADGSSAGLAWTLVELERPNASLFNQDGSFTGSVRHAIQQITDWREWIADNNSHAQASVRQGGLGLPYLRPNARALIVVGRSEEGWEDARPYRLREIEDRGIHIRTYDWLRRTFGLENLGTGQLDRDIDHGAFGL